MPNAVVVVYFAQSIVAANLSMKNQVCVFIFMSQYWNNDQ